jgi:hypothetical protein
MDKSGSRVCAGSQQSLYEEELRSIEEEKLLGRMWAQDETLWPRGETGPYHLKGNLEFLKIPEMLPQMMGGALRADLESRSQGLTDRILIAFGTAHHFCGALLNIHPTTEKLKSIVLDSCHPDAVRAAEARAERARTLVVVVNKSAYRLEDHSLFLYFYKKLNDEFPGHAGEHFVASSERNSFLATIASEYNFRFLQELPAGILAPYCSALFLAILLTGAADVAPEVLRVACQDIKMLYAEGPSIAENPACSLAAILAVAAGSGRRFIHFLAGVALAPLAMAWCPLIGWSLGKGENGLYPMVHTAPCATEAMEADSLWVILRNGMEAESELEQRTEELRSRGTPFVEMTIGSSLDLLRYTVGWQIATVLAAARMGIDPFEGCELWRPRTRAAEMVNNLTPQKNTMERRARIREGKLELFAEGHTRQQISQLNLAECLVSFFKQRRSAAYCGLFVFLEPRQEAERIFARIRDQLAEALRLPVLLAWGPRSMDTYNYLFAKTAPPGMHFVITSDIGVDLKVPGASYTFGQLYQALALGQFEELSCGDGLALRLHVGPQGGEGISQLQNALGQALRRIGP